LSRIAVQLKEAEARRPGRIEAQDSMGELPTGAQIPVERIL
jgi:hypothetical protein